MFVVLLLQLPSNGLYNTVSKSDSIVADVCLPRRCISTVVISFVSRSLPSNGSIRQIYAGEKVIFISEKHRGVEMEINKGAIMSESPIAIVSGRVYVFLIQTLNHVRVGSLCCLLLLLLLLFTAIGFAPGGSSPTLVETKMMKQHYTIITT
jgi:hypothetical protein